MKKYGTIYKITNTINNKVYIGQTVQDPHKRWLEHKRKMSNRHLKSAFELYGKDAFKFEIIEECYSKEQLDEREKFHIAETKDNNYNFRDGGSHGLHSEETKKLMSRPMSEEHKEKIRQKAIGRKPNKKVMEVLKNNNKEKMKPVICIELNKEFESEFAACNFLGVVRAGNISNVCNKKPKCITAYGYHWKYKE